MIFAIAAACMVLIAALALALPLWRPRVATDAGAATANRQVHAARLEELETDLKAGRLSREDYGAARRDLENDLASGLTTPRTGAAAEPQRTWAVIAAVFVAALAGGLYWGYGSWRIGALGIEAASRYAVIDMVDKLAKRLQTPEGQGDLQGWNMLGHTYMIMGRYADGLKAFEHARTLSGDRDPQILASYAEALAITDPDGFMSKAAPLFEKVLNMDPSNMQALWYGGLGALQRGDKKLALQRWNAILALNPTDDNRQYVEQAITAAGGTPGTAATDAAVIGVHVGLAPALAAAVPPDSTVFVYVQPKGGTAGPPLAVKRLQVKDLPLDITLSDQDAVMPGRNLSSSTDVLVMARVSRTGNAVAQPGDLIGRAEWIKSAPKPLSITIDTVVK